MASFWVSAAFLSACAVAFILAPTWRQWRATGRWSLAGLATALAIVPAAAGLYLYVTNWDPQIAERAAEGERLVQQLAEKLTKAPDDVRGWRLLASSYMALERYADAERAYREVWKRTPTPDNELKVSFAEAMVLTDHSRLDGDAGRMFEEVLAAEPNNPKALWYGGLRSLNGGREAEVRARWSRLLAMNPPPDVANLIQTQLAALSGGSPGEHAAGVDGPRISARVRLGEGRSLEQLGSTAMLFLIARAPGATNGPPLAVKRLPPSALPGEFTLSDADSMIPGRSLASFDEITLVARISATGQPTEQPGDWYAQVAVKTKEAGTVDLVIDQVVQ
jgi:cytochrome c-type biogenesis protein CcmH